MRFTTRGRYALRAALALADLGKNGTPVSIHSLSEHERISSVFLEQIFCKLRAAGIVSSVRGPGGGFLFAHPLEKITVKAILDAAGEELDKVFCDRASLSCGRMNICRSHRLWKDITDRINTFFADITLASMLEWDLDGKPDGNEDGDGEHQAKTPETGPLEKG